MNEQLGLQLEEVPASDVIVINGRCTLRAEGEQRVVVMAGIPVHHYDASDAVAASYAMVLLADSGFATQCEIARAFGCTERTVRRHQKRYADGGMTALATKSGWRSGRRRILLFQGVEQLLVPVPCSAISAHDPSWLGTCGQMH